MAGSVQASPRFAPPDPSLPKPWVSLIDGNTGYTYYWNQETNKTQYERPNTPPKSTIQPSHLVQKAPPNQVNQPNQVNLPNQLNVNHPNLPQQLQPTHHSPHVPIVQQNPQAHSIQHSSNIPILQSKPQDQLVQAFHPIQQQSNPIQQQHFNQRPQLPQQVHSSQQPRSFQNLNPNQQVIPLQPLILNQNGSFNPNLAKVSVNVNSAPLSYQPDFNQSHGAFSNHNQNLGNQLNNLNKGHDVVNANNIKTTVSESMASKPSNAIHASVSDVEAFRNKHEVTVIGDSLPPFLSFEAAGFPPGMLKELLAAGFPSPTPIQSQAWPLALSGKDIVAVAKTGSGKTLGYLLPAFMHLKSRSNNPRYGPTALVIAPTRELATQIQDEASKFGKTSNIFCTCIYGGAPKHVQLQELAKGADIVIATPGRLNDFLEMAKINLAQISFLVLDEADRMLDMGFEPQIRKIVSQIPPRHQTLMFTATWPKEVRKIASDLLVNPVQVNIGNTDQLVANKAITQIIEILAPFDKQRRLEQILKSKDSLNAKVIIFCSTKRTCDHLARSLQHFCRALAIHGDKSQQERDHVLNQFRAGTCMILVATDVAARGLDVKDIKIVINFDFPTGCEDYIHRIGRTGRAGAVGMAYTFFSQQDGRHAKELARILEGAGQYVPPELSQMAMSTNYVKGASRWGGGGGGRGMDMNGGGRGGRGRGMGGFSNGGGFGGYGSGSGSFNTTMGDVAPVAVAPSVGRGFDKQDDASNSRWDSYKPVDREWNDSYRERDRERGRNRDGREDYSWGGKHSGRGRDRSRSRSRSSRSRSRSHSPGRGRERERERDRDRGRGKYRGKSGSRSRSRSRSYDRHRNSNFDNGRSKGKSTSP